MSIDVSRGTYRGVARAPANTANRLYTFPDADGTVMLSGSAVTLADPQVVISTEFQSPSAPGALTAAWFTAVAAAGIHGIAINISYAAASQQIIWADAAGLWVCGYTRPLPELVNDYNALTAPAQAILLFLTLDVEVEAVDAADVAAVHAAIAPSTTNVTTAITNPPTPRNITIKPAAPAGSVLAGTCTITGTDYNGAACSETITPTAGSTATISGAKIFSTVTRIDIGATGTNIQVGLGGYYAITHSMVTAAEATGKPVWIYSSWGGWHDIMGDYAPNATPTHYPAYGSFAFGTPWASELLWMRDLYTVAASSMSQAPSDVYTPGAGKVFQSWPTNKPTDWTTRQAVQWADPLAFTGDGLTYDATVNAFTASATGLPGAPTSVTVHTHSSDDSGGSTLTPTVFAASGAASVAGDLTVDSDLKVYFTSGASRFMLGSTDAAHTAATEGLEVNYDFTTDTATITAAQWGTAYKALIMTFDSIVMNAGTSGTAGQVKLDNTTAAIMLLRPRADTNYTTLKRTADTAGDVTLPVAGTLAIQAIAPVTQLASGGNVTTSGTTELVIQDITITNPAQAGQVAVTAVMVVLNPSVAADVFVLKLYIGTTPTLVHSVYFRTQHTNDQMPLTLIATAAVAAAGTQHIKTTATRTSGTGTLGIVKDGASTGIQWIILPGAGTTV